MQATWLRRGTRLVAALVGLAALVLTNLLAQAAPFNGFAPAVPFALPQEDFEIQVMI